MNMQKLIFLCSLIIMSASIVGCSSGSNDSPAATSRDADNLIPTQTNVTMRSTDFVTVAPDATDPNGNTAAGNCAGSYPDASASLSLSELPGKTSVTLAINNAIPNTIFTAWLRLKGTTDDGVSFGGNPLTGRGSTPLAPSNEIPTLLSATGEGNGQSTSPNGLITDENGNGATTIELDFPIDNGAYPFHKFAEFDPLDERYRAENPSAHPVAIVNSATGDVDAPFMIRVVSHCTDNMAHGLEPGVREPWFEIYGL